MFAHHLWKSVPRSVRNGLASLEDALETVDQALQIVHNGIESVDDAPEIVHSGSRFSVGGSARIACIHVSSPPLIFRTAFYMGRKVARLGDRHWHPSL